MNDKELLEHIGANLETREKRGWWYTTVFGKPVRVGNARSIITVSMSQAKEASYTDALILLKAMLFKIVCMKKQY